MQVNILQCVWVLCKIVPTNASKKKVMDERALNSFVSVTVGLSESQYVDFGAETFFFISLVVHSGLKLRDESEAGDSQKRSCTKLSMR